jgi:hypothetical protein
MQNDLIESGMFTSDISETQSNQPLKWYKALEILFKDTNKYKALSDDKKNGSSWMQEIDLQALEEMSDAIKVKKTIRAWAYERFIDLCTNVANWVRCLSGEDQQMTYGERRQSFRAMVQTFEQYKANINMSS